MGRMDAGQGMYLFAVRVFFTVSGVDYLIFSGENIAFEGIASQSHVLWSYGPQLATDGNTQTCSFTTRKDGQRWWQVRP